MRNKYKLHRFISADRIQRKVKHLAGKISRDYRNQIPVLVGVLNGAFMFMADLIRHLDIPVHCEFVKVSSYGGRTTTPGQIKFLLNIRQSVKGRDVIVIEDIIDTGLTASHLLQKLKLQKPRSVRFCALLDKPSRRRVPVQVDYFGFSIPDRFIVGYGIDYDENYRSLPDIRYLGKK